MPTSQNLKNIKSKLFILASINKFTPTQKLIYEIIIKFQADHLVPMATQNLPFDKNFQPSKLTLSTKLNEFCTDVSVIGMLVGISRKLSTNSRKQYDQPYILHLTDLQEPDISVTNGYDPYFENDYGYPGIEKRVYHVTMFRACFDKLRESVFKEVDLKEHVRYFTYECGRREYADNFDGTKKTAAYAKELQSLHLWLINRVKSKVYSGNLELTCKNAFRYVPIEEVKPVLRKYNMLAVWKKFEEFYGATEVFDDIFPDDEDEQSIRKNTTSIQENHIGNITNMATSSKLSSDGTSQYMNAPEDDRFSCTGNRKRQKTEDLSMTNSQFIPDVSTQTQASIGAGGHSPSRTAATVATSPIVPASTNVAAAVYEAAYTSVPQKRFPMDYSLLQDLQVPPPKYYPRYVIVKIRIHKLYNEYIYDMGEHLAPKRLKLRLIDEQGTTLYVYVDPQIVLDFLDTSVEDFSSLYEVNEHMRQEVEARNKNNEFWGVLLAPEECVSGVVQWYVEYVTKAGVAE